MNQANTKQGNTKRRLPKPERRLLIEEAATALFAERGYAGTTLEEIAARAGVTKPLLYQHFPSKKELHFALLAQHRDALLGRLAEGMSRPGPLAERIPRVTDDWFAYVEENPYAWAMLFRDTTGDPEVQAFYGELRASARAANVALIRGERELEVPDDRVEPLAEFIRSALTGVALWWAENPGVPRATIVDVVVGTLMNGLGLEPNGVEGD
jgi:AcrR family transcriptional regulator